VEEGSPLKGGTVKDLTATAMTVFGIERLFLLEEIGHFTTYALSTPFGSKFSFIFHYIWWTVLVIFV
jgi:hypothetical protein